jgi:hypothetical protein
MKVIPETFMCTKDINLLSKTNKYKTKQTDQKYQKERKNPT